VPGFKLLVAGLSPLRPRFAAGSLHVGFVVDKVSLGQVFSEFFGFLCQHIIPLLLHTHLSPRHEVCDSSHHAAHYHTLGPKLGASSLIRHLAGTEERRRIKSEEDWGVAGRMG
jgi:hypothetical protein